MNFKTLSAVLTLSLAAATSTFAHADTIETIPFIKISFLPLITPTTPITGSIGLGGNGVYSMSTGQFTAGQNIGKTPYNAYVNASDSNEADSLSNFDMFNKANFYDFNTSTIGAGEVVFTTAENGQTLTFTLTGVSSTGTNSAGPGFVGTGMLSETGYTDTQANFSLNTNTAAGTVITFNTTAAPTPEPSSLILLGTGVLGAAGMMRRRFSK